MIGESKLLKVKRLFDLKSIKNNLYTKINYVNSLFFINTQSL